MEIKIRLEYPKIFIYQIALKIVVDSEEDLRRKTENQGPLVRFKHASDRFIVPKS